MINEQFLLRKINEQLRDMPEARNKVKRLIYSMDWVDSIKLPEGGAATMMKVKMISAMVMLLDIMIVSAKSRS